MGLVTSKRHKFKFYTTIIFGTLAFAAMGSAMLLNVSKHTNNNALQSKNSVMILLAITIYGFAIYTIYKYYKNAPIIEVDDSSIKIGHETFMWRDIENIELTGKRPFPYFISFLMEAATLTFKNGQNKYFFDDMYENASKLKSFIKSVVIDKKNFHESISKPINVSETHNEYFEIFTGNQLTSLRGISLWGIISLFACFILTNSTGASLSLIAFFIFYSAFWFMLHSWTMNYFKLSERYFLIKNQNLFWRTTLYRLSDINEIVFETGQKRPNCLRVITKDFKSKLYPAATLRDKTWLALKNNLEKRNIKVRNELYLTVERFLESSVFAII